MAQEIKHGKDETYIGVKWFGKNLIEDMKKSQEHPITLPKPCILDLIAYVDFLERKVLKLVQGEE